jgi:hypothetical protein
MPDVDYKKLLKDTIRGGYIDSDHFPFPIGGPISKDEAGDELTGLLTDEEIEAYAALAQEIYDEIVAAGDARCLDDLRKTIDDFLMEGDNA